MTWHDAVAINTRMKRLYFRISCTKAANDRRPTRRAAQAQDHSKNLNRQKPERETGKTHRNPKSMLEPSGSNQRRQAQRASP